MGCFIGSLRVEKLQSKGAAFRLSNLCLIGGCSLAAEELACEPAQQRDGTEHGNQVGNGHQAVQRVSDVPYQMQRADRSEVDERQPCQAT